MKDWDSIKTQHNMGSLAVGASTAVTVTLQGDTAGRWTNTASVTTREGVTDTATLDIDVLAAPGATIIIIDSDDPLRENQETGYGVVVGNQGQSDITNVRVTVQLPSQMTAVGTDPAAAITSADGRTVTFAAIARIGPGDEVTFVVIARANPLPAGDLRADVVSTATLEYDEFTQPVRAEEGTTITQA